MKIDKHHKFSKHKNRIKKYGSLIHDDKNIELIDHDDHINGKHSNFNEREFCKEMGILECKYCKNYLPGGVGCPCLKFYGQYAERCRWYDFSKIKYEKDKK